MGTIKIVNRSTLTDGAAVERVALYLQGKRDIAEVDGIRVKQTGASAYGETRRFLVTEDMHGQR